MCYVSNRQLGWSFILFLISAIIMTPTKKGKATHIKIERRGKLDLGETSVHHVAGGEHQGLVINKALAGSLVHEKKSYLVTLPG